MKKVLLSLSFVAMSVAAVSAQDNKATATKENRQKVIATETMTKPQTATTAPATASSLTPDNVVFVTDNHDFGTLTEGDKADYVFQVKNTGKEPLVIQKVQPSCGCTIPDWSKDPIMPGKTGMVKASYGTQGRPGAFTKTLTVFSNAGTKVLTIKGTVEKAPSSSVPENNSMIRTN